MSSQIPIAGTSPSNKGFNSTLAENVLVNRNVMADRKQNQDEDVIHFAARLQGQAKSCNFSVRAPDGTSVSYADHAVMDQLAMRWTSRSPTRGAHQI